MKGCVVSGCCFIESIERLDGNCYQVISFDGGIGYERSKVADDSGTEGARISKGTWAVSQAVVETNE